jgi:hypothetical protein
MFPKKIQTAIVLFFVSLFFTVGVSACSGPSVKSTKVDTSATAVNLPGAPPPGKALEDIIQRGAVKIAVPLLYPTIFLPLARSRRI